MNPQILIQTRLHQPILLLLYFPLIELKPTETQVRDLRYHQDQKEKEKEKKKKDEFDHF
jgi:hypothetical protein